MYHKLGLISILLLLSLLLSSSPASSQTLPGQASLNPELEWVKNQLPFDQMPECTPVIGLITNSEPPNLNSPACRVHNDGPAFSWKPGTQPPKDFMPASKMGPDKHPTLVPAGTPIVIPSPTITAVQSSSIQSDPNYAWAQNELYCQLCIPSAHITMVQWVSSTNVPALTCCLKSWWNYHYGNRAHVASITRPNVCVTGEYSNMSLGIGYGKLGPQSGSVRVFWENYAGIDACAGPFWDTQWTFASNTTVTFKIVETIESGTYYWAGYGWIANQWRQFFHNRSGAYMDAITMGIELQANAGDKDSVLVPLAFTHKALLITSSGNFPWNNPDLPSWLQNQTSYSADWPFQVLDISGTNFTSVAAETTFQ